MTKKSDFSRRDFLKKSALGFGMAGLGLSPVTGGRPEFNLEDKGRMRAPLVLTLTNKGYDTKKDILTQTLNRLERLSAFQPDIVCLPEAFSMPLETAVEKAEPVPGPTTDRMSAFARKHKCYVICPIYTRRDNKFYNSAVLINREGNIAGIYDKNHPTENECDKGFIPGSDVPVFDTDFGRIGILICFDINWQDKWATLSDKGAEIVFWPSAYPGGRLLSTYAALHNYYVVGSSLTRDPAQIFDISGDLMAESGTYEHWTIARLNLEKIYCEIDFHLKKIKKIHQKYGEKIGVTFYHNEDRVLIESLSPDITIDQLKKEFDLLSYKDYIARATAYQNKFRK